MLHNKEVGEMEDEKAHKYVPNFNQIIIFFIKMGG